MIQEDKYKEVRKNLKEIFRYIETHSFIRDIYQNKLEKEFSPNSFIKALENYIQSENGNLDALNKKSFLGLTKSPKEKMIKVLSDIKEGIEYNNEKDVKNSLTNFLDMMSENKVDSKMMMETYAVLSSVLNLNVDYSELSQKDFLNKDNGKDHYKKVVDSSYVGLGDKNSKIDMASAIESMEAIMQSQNKEKNKNSHSLSKNRKNKNL